MRLDAPAAPGAPAGSLRDVPRLVLLFESRTTTNDLQHLWMHETKEGSSVAG